MSSHTNGGGVQVSPPAAKKAKVTPRIEQIYQKKTQLEHILLRPDTYIGSIEPVEEEMWIFEDEKMIRKTIKYVPGLYKIFDEILVNAADNKQRDKNMDLIKINIDQANNEISIWNNGTGIPVVEHKDEKMFVPTMIFGHLLTSSNFNDDEKKVTGGRNGYGAKLCNVFSTKFVVETAHKKSNKTFKQIWEKNMGKTSDARIKEYSGGDFTKITFKPDLAKFKMENLDDDIVALFSRRAYDVAASSRGVKVMLNGKRVPVKNFKEYVDVFMKDKLDEAGKPLKFYYEQVNDRWEVAVAPSESGFQQISFVNSIATTKGGRHVDYVTDLVVKNLAETVKKKNKNGIDVKAHQIKSHLWIFINCLIENPTFDSQTKENMTLQQRLFGSKCVPSEKFYNAIIKSGIVENILSWAKFKAESLLNKTSAGRKQIKLKGLPKLEDANDAGTKHSMDCTLLLTEGDSAKTIVVAGLGVVGRDKYGVFPLRGKLLNVREASTKQIMENAEINALVKILGLQYRRKYNSSDDMKTLRYGKLMIMTDQDHDGSHIKGLIINFIHHNWPSLLKMNFMEEFITPIVKATKGETSYSFFSIPEFDEWKKTKHDWKKYHIKYYKGLGTSTSKEAKEYFTDISRHRIKFKYNGQLDDDNITMAFSKKCVDQRKDWLTSWMENSKRRTEMGIGEDIIYNKDVRALSYSDFINKELVLFSNLDNERSIPSLVDGLKPGQRKVLYTCFKRNDKREVKVAQLAGSVGEQSAYHHGEASLMSTIINLAQNYVGSNNINLLQPIGQFGSRLMGGKDAASPRYIFTKLSPLARLIFDKKDDPILKPQFDDNQKIEPEWYCPIIPMVLVNGADGIGTGWMTRVPNYNPREIIANLERMIRGEEPFQMQPWYKGFRGAILEISPQKYVTNGEIGILDEDKIEITELPIHTWTQTYKENTVEPMLAGSDKIPAVLTDYKEYHTDVTVKFILQMKPETLRKFEDQGLHRVLKLQTHLNLSSMVLFDQNGCLKKYESIADIMKEFFDLRLKLYSTRKDFLVGSLAAEASKLSNQARFILEKCEGKLVVENKKKKLMIEELFRANYDSDPIKAWKARVTSQIQLDEDENNEVAEADDVEEGKDFGYLLTMQIMSLTLERKEALLKDRDSKLKELELLKRKTPADMYFDDLNALKLELDRVEDEEEESNQLSKKKLLTKKGFNKKAAIAAGPSPMGERVQPRIDEILKKYELLDKAKEKKELKVLKKKLDFKPEVVDDDEDEFDKMVGHTSLTEVLNTSEEKGKTSDSKKKLPKAQPSKPRAQKTTTKTTKKKMVSDDEASGSDFENERQNKSKKGPPKRATAKKRRAIDDSESGSDFSVDDFSNDDSDEEKPKEKKPRAERAAATKKKPVLYDSDSDLSFNGIGNDSGEETQKKKAAAPKPRGGKPVETKKKSVFDDSDSNISFDDIIDDSSDEKRKQKAAGSSKTGGFAAGAEKPKQIFDYDSDISDKAKDVDNSALFDALKTSIEKEKADEVKEKPKPKAAAKSKTAGPAKSRPGKTVSKKKKAHDDSDSDFGFKDVGDDALLEALDSSGDESKKPKSSRPGRSAAAAAKKKYVFDDSASDLSD